MTSHKDPTMFEQTIQQHQAQPVPVQMYSTIEKKDIAPDKGTNVTEFPFCYNVNMLQKVHQTQAVNPTTAAVATITTDEKSCYRFDVSQPFSYNYTLVNQMSLAAAASTATFKCDVCGLVFADLSLLNHHKRIHNNNNSNSLSPERNFHDEPSNEGKVQGKPAMGKTRNCNRCGSQDIDCEHSSNKKKLSKFMKCGNCQAPTPTTPTSTNGSFPSSSPDDSPPEIINIPNKGLHLVKRHGQGLATVTKCHKCNGSGIIFVGGPRPPPSDKPFRCNVCDGSFSRYSSLWSHKRLHSGDKPFKCDLCGLTFARAAYLKNHVRVHSGEKPYKCEICGMQFSQSPHLKNHERIHSGERPYQCEVCEKTFARHSTLWNHRRIHTGEKPYRCSVCGSAFNQATHLKNHAKVHTGEKPHRCDICEVGFSDRFALKRHKQIHEKYGRTKENQSQQSSSPNQQSAPQQQIGEIYKCEVAFPGQQPNPTSNPQSQQSTQKIYKCDASTSVAFSGSQPLQSNTARTSQQQADMYKCDVGTSVSFAGQSQTQGSQSNNQSSQSQNTQMNDVYKVDVNSSSTSYQNSQPPQKQNNTSPQHTSQINDMYKYDVAFPGQTQQSTSQQNNSSNSPQYDVGFSGQKQQNQQTSQQPNTSAHQPTSSGSQKVSQIASKVLYGHGHSNSESILGT